MSLFGRMLEEIFKRDKKTVVSFFRWLLLGEHIPLDYVDERTGESFVSLVVDTGDPELVCEVVEKRDAPLKAINAKSKNGFTALDHALLLPRENPARERIIKMLATNDGRAGYGALNHFIMCGDLEGVKEASAHTISFDERNRDGSTPLMLLAEHGRLELIKHLLEELKICSFQGDKYQKELMEAASIAAMFKWEEVQKYLTNFKWD